MVSGSFFLVFRLAFISNVIPLARPPFISPSSQAARVYAQDEEGRKVGRDESREERKIAKIKRNENVKKPTLYFSLQRGDDVPKIDEVERCEDVRGGDGLALFREGDVVGAAG